MREPPASLRASCLLQGPVDSADNTREFLGMSPCRLRAAQRGLSLIVTLVVTAGVAIAIGSALCLTASRSNLTRRVSQYDRSVAAAVAATQKVHAGMVRDFLHGGEPAVYNNLSAYRGLVPTTAEVLDALEALTGKPLSELAWKDEQFVDAAGQLNQTSVQRRSDWAFRDLQTRLSGLRGYAADYTIIAGSRRLNTDYNIQPTVRQDVQVASIPIFQYHLFYVPDMEIHPSGTGMSFNGRVHCNANIYCKPEGTVTFHNHVTAARKFVSARHPDDPVTPKSGRGVFRAERVTGVNTLNIPIKTANTPANLRALVESPTLLELPSSPLGQQRFYNKADLLIEINHGNIVARSGIYNGSSVPVTWIRRIVTITGQSVYDKRECEEFDMIDVDILKLRENLTELIALLGRPVKIIWIADKSLPATLNPRAVRIHNAEQLPAGGLTIATPNPLYVWGDFNKVAPVPACLAADAVTVLSKNWADVNAPLGLGSRNAVDTIVYAAIITGIVPTGAGSYSGGVENVIRLLENWNGRTLTFNGAAAVLYYSVRANAPWGGPDVYAPPTRKYNYDSNLSQLGTMPPGTPEVRTILHGDWTVVATQ